MYFQMLDAKNESICLAERNVEADRARLDLGDAKETIEQLEEHIGGLQAANSQLDRELETARQRLLVQKETFIRQKENIEHKVNRLTSV